MTARILQVAREVPNVACGAHTRRRPMDRSGMSRVLADNLEHDSRRSSQRTRRLAALRDLLLPKLVTGQIDVSSLDLDALVAERGV